MKKTFVDVLLELPVDTALRDFLTGHGLAMPDDFAWDDTPPASQALVDAIRAWADVPARDRLIGNLMASVQLGDGAGKQALFQAAASDGAALMGLVACQSDVHRSFWLYANHPDLFERACEFDYLERNGTQAQQHDLGVKRHAPRAAHQSEAHRRVQGEEVRRAVACLPSPRDHAAARRALLDGLRGGAEPHPGLMPWSSKRDGQPMAVTHAQITATKGRLRVLRRRSWRRF